MIKHIKNISFNLLSNIKEKAFKSRKFKKIYLNPICTKFDFDEKDWISSNLFLGPQINESCINSVWIDESSIYVVQKYLDTFYRFEYSIDDAIKINIISKFDLPKKDRG